MITPTQRTLAECRMRGWTAAVVEKWNPHARIRQDLFGCIDIVACVPPSMCRPDALGLCNECGEVVDLYCKPCSAKPGRILGIQACAGPSHAARRTKSITEPRLAIWLASGCTFAVWSWAKRGGRGERKLWALREDSVLASEVTP